MAFKIDGLEKIKATTFASNYSGFNTTCMSIDIDFYGAPLSEKELRRAEKELAKAVEDFLKPKGLVYSQTAFDLNVDQREIPVHATLKKVEAEISARHLGLSRKFTVNGYDEPLLVLTGKIEDQPVLDVVYADWVETDRFYLGRRKQ